MEPRWLTVARGYVGQREVKGKKHNPHILRWWQLIRAGFTDDETYWCAGFVGGVLEECGIKSTRSAAARSYEKWGTKIATPLVGCVVTFARRGGGHVGFYVGETATHILVLGGNQGDMVNVSRYSKTSQSLRITGYWWPKGEPFKFAKPKEEDAVEGGSVTDGKPVTLIGQPDDPGVDGDAGPTTFTGKVKHYANLIATGGASLFAGMFDWRVALVICAFGFLVFLVIWYTHMRRK